MEENAGWIATIHLEDEDEEKAVFSWEEGIKGEFSILADIIRLIGFSLNEEIVTKNKLKKIDVEGKIIISDNCSFQKINTDFEQSIIKDSENLLRRRKKSNG